MESKQHTKSSNQYSHEIDLELTRFESNYLAGLYFLQNGNYQLALELLTEAVSEKPKANSIWKIVGAIYMKQGKNSQATRCFEKARDINSGHDTTEDNLEILTQAKHSPRTRNKKLGIIHALAKNNI